MLTDIKYNQCESPSSLSNLHLPSVWVWGLDKKNNYPVKHTKLASISNKENKKLAPFQILPHMRNKKVSILHTVYTWNDIYLVESFQNLSSNMGCEIRQCSIFLQLSNSTWSHSIVSSNAFISTKNLTVQTQDTKKQLWPLNKLNASTDITQRNRVLLPINGWLPFVKFP